MDDEAGGKQPPSLTSCPCMDEGNFDADAIARMWLTGLATSVVENAGCARLVRAVTCRMAALGIGTIFADETDPYTDRDVMADLVAVCLREIVKSVNQNSAIQFSIHLRSVDIETSDRPTAKIIKLHS